MATKTWKIGERAIGGIIKVTITGNVVTIQALDYCSKKEVESKEFNGELNDSYWAIGDYLDYLSTSYHENIIHDWILTKINDKNKPLFRY